MKNPARQYARALNELTEGSNPEETQKFVQNLITYLRKNDQRYLLSRVLKEYKLILVKQNRLPEVLIESAQELGTETLTQILRDLSIPSDVTITNVVKPRILGGVYVKYNDQVFDFSFAHRLERIKHALDKVSIA